MALTSGEAGLMATSSSESGRMQAEPAVSIRGLRKSYGDVDAVAGIDLEIQRGEVFALLGPNGAGKTMTVEILEGYRRRSAGEVSVLGVDPETGGRGLRERVGIVLQASGFGLELTVREAIQLYSAAYPRPLPVGDVTELVGLEENGDALVRNLSGGQRRRLDLALAVAGDPELLFLDEPTTGFDPSARRRSWSLVENLRSLGKTILLTTHYMDEAENLADRVAVMARGRIVAEGSPSALAGRTNGVALVRFRLPEAVERTQLPPLPAGIELELTDQFVSFRTDTPTRALTPLVDWASKRGEELEALTVTRPTLEDVYLELTEGNPS
jgi:ABC-2 type transport system ATP-binding protein